MVLDHVLLTSWTDVLHDLSWWYCLPSVEIATACLVHIIKQLQDIAPIGIQIHPWFILNNCLIAVILNHVQILSFFLLSSLFLARHPFQLNAGLVYACVCVCSFSFSIPHVCIYVHGVCFAVVIMTYFPPLLWSLIVKVMKKCPNPEHIDHGSVRVVYSIRYFRQLYASYSCDRGHALRGQSRRNCDLLTGEWEGPAPTCQECKLTTIPITTIQPHGILF